jgi:hypothetical protein
MIRIKLILLILFLGLWNAVVFSQNWTQITAPHTSPTPREYPSGNNDITSNTMIIFGGVGGASDTWLFNPSNGLGATPAWTQLNTSGTPPSYRFGQSGMYDSLTDTLIIFGGYDLSSSVYLNDTWILTHANGTGGNSNWAMLNPSGTLPNPRYSHSAVYDDVNNRMIVFGGETTYFNFIYNIYNPTNDTWVLSNANGLGGTPTWTQLSTIGSLPDARLGHSAVYDSVHDRMMIFGGNNGSAFNYNDVWVLPKANAVTGTTSWIQLNPTGTPPSPRYGQTAVYDSYRNWLIVFGGYDGSNYLNDTWVLTGANGLGETPAWVQLMPSGTLPTERSEHTAVYDYVSSIMTIFGGASNSGYLNDLWTLHINVSDCALFNDPD